MLKYWLKFLMFHVKLNMAEGEGGGDGGEGGDPGANPGDGGAGGNPAQRPDFVPEKFWDPDKGELRTEDAFNSYKELERKISTAGETAVEEYKNSLKEGLPKTKDEYKVELDPAIIPEGMDGQLMIPEGDPMLEWFKGYAFDNGIGTKQFNEMVNAYIKQDIANAQSFKGQIDQLGEKGQERVDRVDMYLQRVLKTPEQYEAIARVADSPAAIEALETIIDSMNEPDLYKGEGFVKDGQVTREDLRKMMDDPRYWQTKDPAYIAEVQKLYSKVYPGKQMAN